MKSTELVGGPYVTASTNSMYSYAQKVGYNISAIYGYKTDGLLQASDFAADGTPLIPVISKAQPGDIKYVDFNNDKIIDGNDQTIIGNAVPKLNFSADIAVRYKNFDLEVLLQGTGQSDAVLLGMLANPLDMSFDGGIPTTYYSTRYWQPTRTDARFPRITTSPANSKLTSDFWFENAAYMRIKFAQFGYNLASNSLKRVGISNIRLYLNAQNPYTFSSLKIMDPESRGNQWTYPVMQMYTIGANVKF
ncbi:hypothetical protein MKQ70_21380 [Chitinophaga sedimenti]|uniref:hypothetical protein n=1 Tax=Chitinophaga sedimenti TaxID=2033606 RepID=UPI0020065D43|nr:hypothetical protein [Chitinophaga sedimenti]MCK7557416.1 hypothetical protein [Chitinophaga sedimenti]